MRIVTWNLNNAGAATKREARVWSYLREHLRPDVALLQEVREPGGEKSSITLRPGETAVWTLAKRDWGTAIVAFGPEVFVVESIGFLGEPGRCVAARFGGRDDGAPLMFASLHAPTTPTVFPGLERAVADLESRYPERLIIGGDFNTARVADKRWPGLNPMLIT